MGLDNYPVVYPCKKQNTAVFDDDGAIDCQMTMDCDGCPWKQELGNEDGQVLGIFGAPCWYRGNWGNRLMVQLGIGQSHFGNFYDDELRGDIPIKSPMSCLASAEMMEEALGELRNVPLQQIQPNISTSRKQDRDSQ